VRQAAEASDKDERACPGCGGPRLDRNASGGVDPDWYCPDCPGVPHQVCPHCGGAGVVQPDGQPFPAPEEER